MAFNGLSDAEAERLALLLEELGEAQQAIGKILRHGYENYHPEHPERTNRKDLERELGDVVDRINLMSRANDISPSAIAKRSLDKFMSRKYLHHQDT